MLVDDPDTVTGKRNYTLYKGVLPIYRVNVHHNITASRNLTMGFPDDESIAYEQCFPLIQ